MKSPIQSGPRRELEDAARSVGCHKTGARKVLKRLGTQALRVLGLHAQLKLPRHRWKLAEMVRAWAERFESWQLSGHLLEAAILPDGVTGTLTIYVSSVSGDGTDGLTWAKAEVTVAAGLGDATDATFNFVYVDSAHTFTATAAITWTCTANATTAIISVDRNGSTTTGHNGWLGGADENIGASANVFTIANTNEMILYCYGLTIVAGTANNGSCDIDVAANASHVRATFESCIFTIPTVHSGGVMSLGPSSGAAQQFRFCNCTINVTDNASAQPILLRHGIFEFSGLTIAFAGAAKPTSLFRFGGPSSNATLLTIFDSDISGYNTTSGSYFLLTNFALGSIILVNCKTSSVPTLVSGTWPTNTASITLINTDSGDTHNVFEFRNRLGTITENATNIANSGAQFDGIGISWEIVTTSLCSESNPFICPWISRWTTATGSLDLHLQLLRDSVTDYTNRQVWGEFECLESASFPNGTLTSTRNAQPFDGSDVDLTNSAQVWTESLTNDNEMEVRVTRTIAEKSLARARLVVGVASTTLYLDPSLWIGSQGANPAVRWTPDGAVCAEPASGGGGPVGQQCL